MTTAILSPQRTAHSKPFAALSRSVVVAWRDLFGARGDSLEQFLAKSKDHADLAIRQRVFAEHEARMMVLNQVL